MPEVAEGKYASVPPSPQLGAQVGAQAGAQAGAYVAVRRVEHHVGVEQPAAAAKAVTVVKIKSLFMAEISSIGRTGAQWRGCGSSNSTSRRVMCKFNVLIFFHKGENSSQRRSGENVLHST